MECMFLFAGDDSVLSRWMARFGVELRGSVMHVSVGVSVTVSGEDRTMNT